MYIKNKIILITVYLGEWPWYFPYYIYTCKFNYSIDFVLFCEIFPKIEIPPNVYFHNYSLQDFKRDASEALGFDINIDRNYKLCDFKPAYGLIFEKYICDYNFWGYCDIDIIWGNIRSFLTDNLLDVYDVISMRHDYLTGCFALYKNSLSVRKLFMESKDYRKVFISTNNFFFDETNFAFEEFGKGEHYSKIVTEIESMTHVVKRLDEEKIIKAYFEFQIVEGFAGNMLWENGILVYRKEFEVMLYHMVRFKNKYSETNDGKKQIPNKFRIGKRKIYF